MFLVININRHRVLLGLKANVVYLIFLCQRQSCLSRHEAVHLSVLFSLVPSLTARSAATFSRIPAAIIG